MVPMGNYFNTVTSTVSVMSESCLTTQKLPRINPYKNVPLIQSQFNNSLPNVVGSGG